MKKIYITRNTRARDAAGKMRSFAAEPKKAVEVGKDVCEEDAKLLLRMGKALPADTQTRSEERA